MAQSRLVKGTDDSQLIHEKAQQMSGEDQRIIPRFADCSFASCERSAARDSSCPICRNHFCGLHDLPKYHPCPLISELQLDGPSWENMIHDEVAAILSQVNVDELTRQASELNSGKKCSFRPGTHLTENATMGSANYHAYLVFDDGTEWLVRIRRANSKPPELDEYLVESEYATLKFLESTNVPAPRAYGFGLASDPKNKVGVSYLLIECLPGKPYQRDDASLEQQHHVIGRLADILVELSKHPLPKAGSLIWKDGKPEISAVASNRFFVLGQYGPFETASQYFTSIADQYLDLIADGQVHYEHAKEAFVFYHVFREHIDSLCHRELPGTFYLKHVDDKGDHLLVDEDFNVTGIIDWQFARSVPACEAFGPSLVTADLGALYSGLAGVTEDDKLLAQELRARGRMDLAELAEENELARRFQFGLASDLEEDEVPGMLRGLQAVLGNTEVGFHQWIAEKMEDCRNDPRWCQVEALESAKEGHR